MLALVGLLACAKGNGELGQLPGPGPDAGSAGVDANPNDLDGDGYEVDVDCNDGNSAVHPDAGELCDRVDQDCDGTIDEDTVNGTVYYADHDGDGHGRPDETTTACNPPADFVPAGDDCYDDNADVFPGQTEFFTVDRGDGSFDYNCSQGTVESSVPQGHCEFNGTDCGYVSGWDGGAPACGTQGETLTACIKICVGLCVCTADTVSTLNECN